MKCNHSFEGIHYLTGEYVTVKVAGERIVEIEGNDCTTLAEKDRIGKQWIAPGLVDLQINGFKGMDYNTISLTDDVALKVTKALWQEGITSYYPTVITNSDETIEALLRNISDSCSQDTDVAQGIAGIHLEGPFISPEEGPRGAHSIKYVKAPDWSLFERWQDAAQGKIKIITISPEWPGAIDFIIKCVEAGIVVSIGHTNASSEQIAEAVAAGARMSTHLGNGAHSMLPRHPNYIWDQLVHDELWACMIADGFHLPDSVLQVIMKVKGNRAMLVSDAVQLSGLAAGEYDLHIGGKVVLTVEGKLHLADNPKLLAGSCQMLTWGIGQLVKKRLCSLGDAWEMASVRPAQFMNLPAQNGLVVGAPADFVLFDYADNGIEIVQTIKNGQLVYSKE